MANVACSVAKITSIDLRFKYITHRDLNDAK